MMQRQVPFGVGIYSRTEAARLLRMTPRRLGRWIVGYTYWLKSSPRPRRRRQPPVVQTDLPRIDGSIALSFLELMELRVAKAFVDRGIPLQRVRVAAKLASEMFQTSHPFAYRRVFTDGQAIFAALPESGDTDIPDVVQLTRDEHFQIIAGPIFAEYMKEIEFDERTSLAHRWWPLGRQVRIVLDPAIAFGAPVIEGTATRTDVVSRMARASSPALTAQAYRIAANAVEAAVSFETLLAAA